MKQSLIAKSLLAGTEVSENDAARLTLEAIETLGELSTGTSRPELVTLLRRVIQAGVAAVRAAERTVPLSVAAANGHLDCVQMLLEVPGIAVNLPDNEGETPLAKAAYHNRPEVVNLLLAAPGIDINARNEDGATVLHIAALNDFCDCVRQLLAAPGININAWDGSGNTPLDMARYNRKSASADLFLQAGGMETTTR